MGVNTVLEVQNVFKRYGPVEAVNGVSFSIASGTCFGLLGPNGAGKTTTVEIMEGITRADSGQVLYLGRPLDDRFREHAGIQFQHTALQDFLTVKETLALFSRLYRHPVPQQQLVEKCALEAFLHQDTHKLSGGQRQRLLLALALVNDPQVLFLDEPTTGLDPQARHNFWRLIEDIKHQNKTIVLTTHYMEEAAQLCDEIAIMDHGQVIASGSPQALLKSHYDEMIISLPQEDVPADFHAIEHFRQEGQVLIHSKNIHQSIQELHAEGIALERMQIRARTLEDLFLELTGKGLRQ